MNEDLIRLINQFLNERGLVYDFSDFAREQGYTLEELGFDKLDEEER